MRSLTFPVLFAVLSCGPPTRVESIEIVEVVALDDQCGLADTAREAGVLDLAFGEQYFAPVRFEALTNGTSNGAIARITGSRVFFTADDDLVLATTPHSAETAFITALGGVVANGYTPADIAFTAIIPPALATSLSREPAVIAALSSSADRFRVNAHVALDGFVEQPPGAGPARDQLLSSDRFPATPADVVEPLAPAFFPFSIDLCAGCLRPLCAPDEVAAPGACVPGQDEPGSCAVLD